ncbi:MAG: SUMF1/EgtB/PvdO family nonheme iron enzyme, partial [Candidatus Zophobacter franzmannii]|nr:SUMF1/EgtB/PvdO family nonheme iron enzyme [Candidatus Zophobacter franzmannii]
SYGIRSIRSGEVYTLKLTGDRIVTLIPVVVTCNQNGAELFVDDVSMGKTANKMLTVDIESGTHTIKLAKEGFSTEIQEKIISRDKNSFNIKLSPSMPATVEIDTEPEGATVYIDNLKFGVTPITNFFNAGTYPIRIEMENYETITEQITIVEPKTQKSFNLTDIMATLTVKTHPNATVAFNGESFKGGITDLKIAPQVLSIVVTMPKAETITRAITLQPKSSETFEIYPDIQAGVIQVVAIPENARIELNGDGGEYYTATGRKTFNDVPIGEYELIVTADKFKTHKENFSITDDETVPKQIVLEEGSDIIDNMVFVKGGTFQMGSNSGDKDEEPLHSVTVSNFYIGKYEVTQKKWETVMGYNPSHNKGDNNPMEKTSWSDAVKFCNELSVKEGLEKCYSGSGKNIQCNFNTNGYRLPSEAEWEYAAKGGSKSKGYTFSGSNILDNVAWSVSNSSNKTHTVGTKQANELGIYDMSGNVLEWCWDWYGRYSAGSQTNPTGGYRGSCRIYRGASWSDKESSSRVVDRSYATQGIRSSNTGFRLVRSMR